MGHRLAENLTRLMEDAELGNNELALAIGLSVNTITMLRSNKESNPTFDTLSGLADYFKITIDQLLGFKVIGDNPAQLSFLRIPVLELEEIVNLESIKKAIKSDKKSRKWVSVAIDVSANAFAILAKGTQTAAKFQEGGVLIFDPAVKKKDQDYVIVLPQNHKVPVVRQYITTGTNEYFKNAHPEIKEVEAYNSYKVLAVMQQVQIDYQRS